MWRVFFFTLCEALKGLIVSRGTYGPLRTFRAFCNRRGFHRVLWSVPYPSPNLEVQGLSLIGSLPIGQSNVVGPTGHQSPSRHSCWVLLGTLKHTSFTAITRQAQDGDRVTYANGEGKYVRKFPRCFHNLQNCGTLSVQNKKNRASKQSQKSNLCRLCLLFLSSTQTRSQLVMDSRVIFAAPILWVLYSSLLPQFHVGTKIIKQLWLCLREIVFARMHLFSNLWFY